MGFKRLKRLFSLDNDNEMEKNEEKNKSGEETFYEESDEKAFYTEYDDSGFILDNNSDDSFNNGSDDDLSLNDGLKEDLNGSDDNLSLNNGFEEDSFGSDDDLTLNNQPSSNRNFNYLNNLIHSHQNEINLDSDIVFDSQMDNTYLEGINLDMDNLTIDGNGRTIDAQKKSRIFNVLGENIRFTNITFKNAYSNEDGGAISIGNYSSVYFENCHFISNDAGENDGGAISIGENSICTIKDSVFKQNKADSGGAIVNEGTLKIMSSNFEYNSSQVFGGAIYTHHSKVEIAYSVFKNNISSSGGGIYVLFDCDMIIEESLFIDNASMSEGGAMANEYGGKIRIHESLFRNNHSLIGGALCNKGSPVDDGKNLVSVSDSKFEYNSSIENNDTIYSTGVLKLEGNTFNENDRILASNNPEIINSKYVEATEDIIDLAKSIDYSIAGESNPFELLDSDIRNFNYLENLIRSSGGEIILDSDIILGDDEDYTDGIRLSNENLRIDGNGYSIDAKSRSRIFSISQCNITFENLRFKNAYSEGNGGAIYSVNSFLTFKSCSFENNSSDNGGGISTENSTNEFKILSTENNRNEFKTLLFEDCSFENNSSRSGGAISTENNDLILKTCLFDRNESNLGAAIICQNGKVRLDNCGFKENIASDGAAIYYSSLPIGTYINDDSVNFLEINDSVFEANRLTGTNLTVSIIDCDCSISFNSLSFKDNKFDYGDLINQKYLENKNSIIKSSKFIGNGGGITASNLKVISCEFIDNRSNAFSSQEYFYDGSSEIEDCTFKNNHCAISSHESSLKIKDARFYGNDSAIMNRGKAYINDSRFRDNSMAIENSANSYMFASNLNLLDNASGESHDMINQGHLSVIDSDFINCNKTLNLICQEDNEDAVLDIEGCSFKTDSKRPISINGGSSSILYSRFELDQSKIAIFNDSKLNIDALSFKDYGGNDLEGKLIYNNDYLKSKTRDILDKIDSSESAITKYAYETLPADWKGFDYLINLIKESNGEVKLDCDILINDIEEDYYGGGIELFEDGLTIDGQGHTIDADNLSRIFYVVGNDIVLKNIKFINGFEPLDQLFNRGAGAIYIVHGASLKIVNCEFYQNSSKSFAGVIANKGDLTVIDSIFRNNFSNRAGAFLESRGESHFIGCRFEGNNAKSAGGAIAVSQKGKTIVEKSSFKENELSLKGSSSGGAISNSGELDVIDSEFIKNKSAASGGAINSSSHAILSVRKSVFIENASFLGGAINADRYGDLIVMDSCFKANAAAYSSGAIYDSTDESGVHGCEFLTESDKVKYALED